MKITYTSYRPIAYWKWETKIDAALPPIPKPSGLGAVASSSTAISDSDSDSDSDAPGPSNNIHRTRTFSPSTKAARATARAERVERAIVEAKNQCGLGSDDEGDEDDCCGICQEAFEAACPSCRMPGDDCPLMYGKCTHVFHMHCILTWLDNDRMARGKCPLDRRPFETAEQAAPPGDSDNNVPLDVSMESEGTEGRRGDDGGEGSEDEEEGDFEEDVEEEGGISADGLPPSSPDPLAINASYAGGGVTGEEDSMELD